MISWPGEPLDPRSQEYALVALVVHTVEKRIGRKSRWNGDVFEEDNQALNGTAYIDGTMTVSAARVLEPLRKTFSGQAMTDDELSQLYAAMVTLTHESLHLCSDIGPVDLFGDVDFDTADLALDEGLIDAWTHLRVASIVYATDLDLSYPGVLARPSPDSYPALQAATKKLVYGVSTLSGLHNEEVVRRLLAAQWNHRFGVLADLAIEQRLDRLGGDRAALRVELETPLREQFGQLMEIQKDTSLDCWVKASKGTAIATQALARFSDVLSEAELREAAAEQTLDPGRPSTAGQIESPQFNRLPPWQLPQPGEQYQLLLVPGQHQRGEAGQDGSEIDELRSLIDGERPSGEAVGKTVVAEAGAVPNNLRQPRIKPDHGQAVD